MKNNILNMKRAAVGLAIAAISSAPAFAALDAAIETQMGEAKTDVQALGALGLGIIVVIAIYKYLRRGV